MTLWYPLPHRGLVAVSGTDRRAFLQGLLTQDVEKLTPGRILYSLFLTPQGRFLYDPFLFEAGETIYLEIDRDGIPDFVQRLRLYKLRSQVIIEPVGATVWANWEDPAPLPHVLFQGADPRSAGMGNRGWTLEENTAEESSAYHHHRVALGIPEGRLDMIPEKSIPLECRMDYFGAIDWQKGCYLGQELTARTRYRGLVRKELWPVRYQGVEQPAGSEIFRGTEVQGELHRSYEAGSHWVALALMRLEGLDSPEPFVFADGTPVLATRAA